MQLPPQGQLGGPDVISGPNGAGLTVLPTLNNGNTAVDINASGQVTGYSNTSTGLTHAYITSANGTGITDLGTLGGSNSYGLGINTSGQVTGYAYTAGNVAQHAFITGANGAGMNDAGVAVGESNLFNGLNHAFVYGLNGSGMTDLNSFFALSGGEYFSEAMDINNNGQILAYSNLGNSYLLSYTPDVVSAVPEPGTIPLMLAGLGMIATISRRRRANSAV